MGNTGLIPLTCALSTACRGTLSLGPPGAVIAANRTHKAVSYGRATFSIRAGHTQSIRIKLNAAGQKRLRGHTSLRVAATAKVGTKAVTTIVTLRRAARRART